ncbi:DUF2490 domain-containing protein [Nitrosococcus watsonii]|uniref:Lipoprotein n=1 Tax=Nitrosococcus watsoni (strain C-113) TaxID=105559 RepID=D8K681_NITWC|nr:DUF2490 domain-containing protein [Nitrosococcus watsonii]ADJ28408.1 Protein of unknown function DUF2490 [Nitrosococcus watsonii C-113]
MKIKILKTQLVFVLISFLTIMPALADTDNIFGSWTSVTLQGDFGFISPEGKDFRWIVIDQARTRDDKDLNPSRYPGDNGFSPRFSENLVWIQGGYNLTEHSSIWLGYTHDWIKPLNGAHLQESRPYQDYLWSDKVFGNFTAMTRTRLEERVAISGQNSGEVGIRIRQLAMLKHPIPNVKDLSVYVGDEVLAYLNENKFGPEGFSENRAFGGLSYQLTQEVGLMLGYLGQYLKNPGGNDLFTHNVQFDINYKF